MFVSSTFIDLKSERQAAVEAILKAGHIPAGMELLLLEMNSIIDYIPVDNTIRVYMLREQGMEALELNG